MKIQTHPLVIPAKAGTQEKIEKERPISYKLGKNCFVSKDSLGSCLRT
ncbi:MAG: hypothetical protein KBD90_03550 [Alphaproteobacteria bacterium]|nr:hypothetical protein [Alphaproteobacteria bacterium]